MCNDNQYQRAWKIWSTWPAWKREYQFLKPSIKPGVVQPVCDGDEPSALSPESSEQSRFLVL